MFITISGESAALTYLETKPDKTFSPLCVCEHCAFTAFTADWLLPVVALRVTRARNQSDGAVGGTMLEIPSQNATPSVHGKLIALQTSFCDVFIANVSHRDNDYNTINRAGLPGSMYFITSHRSDF